MLDRADLTAAAGPVLAVDRRKFLELGGYDPIFFPGRIEDLDLGFRGWMAGYRGYYVPESVAFHRGFGTFEPQLGKGRCDELASRNTLIFMWKNTSGPGCRFIFLAADPDCLCACCADRFRFARGLWGALSRELGARRPGVLWLWGRGAGSRGKRRFFGSFDGESGELENS